MKNKILVRGIGNEFEDYIFLKDIAEFEEFYLANAKISAFTKWHHRRYRNDQSFDEYTVYDITLKGTGEHFWLMETIRPYLYACGKHTGSGTDHRTDGRCGQRQG